MMQPFASVTRKVNDVWLSDAHTMYTYTNPDKQMKSSNHIAISINPGEWT